MTFGAAGGPDIAGLGFRRRLLGLRALAERVTCPFRRHEGTQNVDRVQELPELASCLVQVAGHPVLTATDLPVLIPQSGDAGLELLQDLQAALRDVTMQRCQPGLIEQ